MPGITFLGSLQRIPRGIHRNQLFGLSFGLLFGLRTQLALNESTSNILGICSPMQLSRYRRIKQVAHCRLPTAGCVGKLNIPAFQTRSQLLGS